MPVRIRFTGAATNNATLTISWAGGYPPGATASAVETFKTIRSTFFQTQISSNATTQAANFLYAITTDYGANFVATQIGNDVIVTPKNGTTSITATTTSANVQINPMVPKVQVIKRSQEITPVYNPVIFNFFSVDYASPGFRYLVDLYNLRDSSKIASFKVLPINDGSGYIDISKPLSNLVSVDFKNSGATYDADQVNSYVDYEIQLGKEYQFNWPFDSISSYGGTGPYSTKTRLNNSLLTLHSYTVGDQINISTYPTGTSGPLTGLHRVVAIPSTSSIVVDVNYTGATGSSTILGGITSFADGRKTSFPNDNDYSGLAFNGACTFQGLRNFGGGQYLLQEYLEDGFVVSSILNSTSDRYDRAEWWMNNNQFMDINVLIDPQATGEYICKWDYLNKAGTVLASGSLGVGIPSGNSYAGKMKQFRIGFANTVGTTNYPTGYALQFWIEEDYSSTQVSRNYFVYHDKRCPIEPYVIAFMDRFGSIMSYSFPLRAKESGKIKRDTYTKTIDYQPSVGSYANIYPTTAAGDTTYSVNLEKELELNTNWMSDFMSESFEELLTSPYTWIKMPDNNYYACTVQETGFETERQKNKRLIRKTVKVKLANENVINI
jgi:hypothetical protein